MASNPEDTNTVTLNESNVQLTTIFTKMNNLQSSLKTGLIRLDDKEDLKELFERNAFHDTLQGVREISQFEAYRVPDKQEIICFLSFGDRLNGHKSIVHGGIISLAFDNTFGWLFVSMNVPFSFTANLNINFRNPLPENSRVILKAKITEIQGRKTFMSATMESYDGTLYAEATTLFISPNPKVQITSSES